MAWAAVADGEDAEMGYRTTRGGYSLLEILLAMALALLLLGGLYVAVSTQFTLATAGRNLVERTTLARAIFARMSTDIAATTTLVDPGRYRRDEATASGATNAAADTAQSATETTTPMTGTTGGTTPGTTGTTGTTSTTSPSPSTTDSSSPSVSLVGPAVLPIGLIGDSTTLNLMVTRLPREIWRSPTLGRMSDVVELGIRPEDGTQLVSDLRVVSYWLAGDPASTLGLARFERKIVTTEGALNQALPEPELHQNFVIASEVKNLSFEYFDGVSWTSSWDSNLPGEDGMTPMGPPRAIRITLEVDFSDTTPGALNNPNSMKIFRHVVAINTANGAPMIMLEDPEGGTLPEDSGSGTTDSTGGTGMTSGGSQ